MTAITRQDVELAAQTEGIDVLAAITLMQASAANLDDGESVLEALCAIKSQIIDDRNA